MKKTTILLVLVIIIFALVGVVYYANYYQNSGTISTLTPPPSPAPVASQGNLGEAPDDTASISSDLEMVDVGDLDEEFADIDRDLNSL